MKQNCVIKLSMVYVEWQVSVIHRRWWLDAIITCCRNVTCHFSSRCHVSCKSLVSVAHWCLQQQETSNSFMAFSRQVGWVGTRYSNKCSTNSHYGTLWTLLLGLIVVSIFSIFYDPLHLMCLIADTLHCFNNFLPFWLMSADLALLVTRFSLFCPITIILS